MPRNGFLDQITDTFTFTFNRHECRDGCVCGVADAGVQSHGDVVVVQATWRSLSKAARARRRAHRPVGARGVASRSVTRPNACSALRI